MCVGAYVEASLDDGRSDFPSRPIGSRQLQQAVVAPSGRVAARMEGSANTFALGRSASYRATLQFWQTASRPLKDESICSHRCSLSPVLSRSSPIIGGRFTYPLPMRSHKSISHARYTSGHRSSQKSIHDAVILRMSQAQTYVPSLQHVVGHMQYTMQCLASGLP